MQNHWICSLQQRFGVCRLEGQDPATAIGCDSRPIWPKGEWKDDNFVLNLLPTYFAISTSTYIWIWWHIILSNEQFVRLLFFFSCRPAQVGAEEPADKRSQVKSDINLKENAQGLIYVYVIWLGIFRKLANIVKLQNAWFSLSLSEGTASPSVYPKPLVCTPSKNLLSNQNETFGNDHDAPHHFESSHWKWWIDATLVCIQKEYWVLVDRLALLKTRLKSGQPHFQTILEACKLFIPGRSAECAKVLLVVLNHVRLFRLSWLCFAALQPTFTQLVRSFTS